MALLYTADQVRELDRRTIEDEGVPGLSLMRRAAAACVDVITARYGSQPVTVFCGSGNNAGDGYIIAGMLAERGWPVRVRVVGDIAKLGADATAAYNYCVATPAALVEPGDEDATLIVDALLGTGVNGEVRPAFAEVIDLINDSGAKVLAVDIPSGLSADTGESLGATVRADITVTFIGRKRGLYTAAGPDHAGEVVFASLDVPDAVFSGLPGLAVTMDDPPHLSPRLKNSHKNTFGHVLVVGGDHGMGGAILMAGEAALRAGAGLVTVATRGEHATAIMARCPEIMCRGVKSADDLAPLLEKATVVVAGPGLGTNAWGEALLHAVLATSLPLVLDADGLNLLPPDAHRDNWILTPHPGEARRLGAGSQDRFADVASLQASFGGVVVLKGVGSLIAGPSELALCPHGNPGMASAGMGDVLSGIAGALLAQTGDVTHAARLAVHLHARAGDIAADADGMRGLVATDLLPHVRSLLG